MGLSLPLHVGKLLPAALALLLLISAAAYGESRPAGEPVPQIHVNGEASVDLAPDMAIITLGVQRQAKSAREALDQNNAAMADVVAAMKAAGIAAKDLQTANFAIQPRYQYYPPKDGEEQKPPKIIGYTVSNNLAVRIRDLSKLGTILDEAVTLGVNTGGQIHFANDDPKEAIAEARANAMRDALARARTLAEAADVSLGKILTINESFVPPRPVPMARGKMMSADVAESAVPIESGENSYSVTVSASFAIDQ